MIRDNITRVLEQIDAACAKIEADPKDITCVAITKFADIPQIKEAIDTGLVHIGENKVQEARDKFSAIKESYSKVTMHMVGHLQTNKVKAACEIFDVIQSVDSQKLAVEIEEEAAKLDKDMDIFIQVNTALEDQKFGIVPSELFSLVEQVVELKHLRLRGLMTVAPMTEDKDIIRKCFRDLRMLRDGINMRFSGDNRIALEYLSMGMTNDFDIAIEEGANMIRIGRAIFCDPDQINKEQ